ncbi:hypothetical protein, partial [Pseudarthrobacter sp. C1]|uniref:hypothetical protein n=1 Tax=Pseudarthrobacter sp. C1 TaxID=3108940 RepID=UPI002B05C0B1
MPVCNVNVLDVTVEASIASENVPVAFAVTATPVAPAAGDVLVTVGAVVSPGPPVPPLTVRMSVGAFVLPASLEFRSRPSLLLLSMPSESCWPSS